MKIENTARPIIDGLTDEEAGFLLKYLMSYACGENPSIEGVSEKLRVTCLILKNGCNQKDSPNIENLEAVFESAREIGICEQSSLNELKAYCAMYGFKKVLGAISAARRQGKKNLQYIYAILVKTTGIEKVDTGLKDEYKYHSPPFNANR